jgi:cytochrome P450
VGRFRFLVLVDPEHVQRVLVSHRHEYEKARSYDGLRAITGDSVLTLNGDPWKERRALAQPAFQACGRVRPAARHTPGDGAHHAGRRDQHSYVRQVIDELMRPRPPVPMIAREAVAEHELGGFRVAQGADIVLFFWGVHRHPESTGTTRCASTRSASRRPPTADCSDVKPVAMGSKRASKPVRARLTPRR